MIDPLITIVAAEFGPRANAGDSKLHGRLWPMVPTAVRHIPGVDFVIYTDRFDEMAAEMRRYCDPSRWEIRPAEVPARWGVKHPRHLWRMNDLWKVKGLLHPRDEDHVAVALDADMAILGPAVKSIEFLANAFSAVAAPNARGLVGIDAASKCDGGMLETHEESYGYAYAGMPIAIASGADKFAIDLVNEYCRQMVERPVRGPLAMWRAVREMMRPPMMLAPQWCVTAGMEEIREPIIAHFGHKSVQAAFAGMVDAP